MLQVALSVARFGVLTEPKMLLCVFIGLTRQFLHSSDWITDEVLEEIAKTFSLISTPLTGIQA
jgi:DUF1365 family protein